MRSATRKKNPDWQILEMQSRICKAFANPTRLYILHLLGEREWAVSDLQKRLAVSVPNLSQHMAILKAAGIVVTRREGKRIYCSLEIPEVKQACALIHSVLRRQIQERQKLVA
jgi:DNA-binding transcriptional ArsR family regulator